MRRREFISVGLTAVAAESLGAQTLRGLGKLRGETVASKRAIPQYVFSIGQSLACGGAGDPALTTTQPYTNQMFVGGTVATWYPDAPPVASIASLVPLIEGVSHNVESHCSSFANQISAWARAAGYGAMLDTIGGSWGVGGTGYSGLKKGTTPYQYSMDSVSKVLSFYRKAIVPAILCVHGENDGPCNYALKVEEWQSDYQSDLQALTGQTGLIPMLISQVQVGDCNSGPFPADPINGDYSGMLGAFEAMPTKIVLCNPKYIFPYGPGGTHLTNAGYRWMGEYYAKAYWRQIVLRRQWTPVRPLSVSISTNVVTIQFTVPVPPLVLDTTNVSQLGDGHYGFEWAGSGGETITNVAITDATNGVVQITLSGTPASVNGYPMRYAFTGTPTGPVTGCRGCLRDSDSVVSLSGNTLYNWCVHFCKNIPFTSP